MLSEESAAPTFVGVVRQSDANHMGHASPACYADMFDAADWVFFTRHGLTREYFEQSGCGMAALTQEATYQKELFPGDAVAIFTTLVEVREKTVRYRHYLRLVEDGELAATSEFIAAHLDRRRHRATPFPDAILMELKTSQAPRG